MNSKQKRNYEDTLAIVSRFRTRALGEIPTEPGFCIPHGFIRGVSLWAYKSQTELHMKDKPDLLTTVLFQMNKALDMKELTKRAHIGVSGRAQINGVDVPVEGWDASTAYKDNIYQFASVLNGVENDSLKPSISVQFTIPPIPQEQTLLEFKHLLASIRMRPENEQAFIAAKRAFDKIKNAAERGDAKAQVQLGKLYKDNEVDPEKKPSTASRWFREAAKQGNVDGLYYAAMDEDDDEKKLEMLRKSAELGHALASFELAEHLAYSREKPEDQEEARKWLLKAAEMGNVDAYRALGKAYEGRGLFEFKKNLSKSKEWYQKAAEQGDEYAQDQIKEIEETEQVIRAAEQGDAKAQIQLGEMYRYGQSGLEENKAQAIELFRKAADQKNAEGLYRLATEMQRDDKTKWDEAVIRVKLREAAELGHAEASLELANHLVWTPPKDQKEASKWLFKAAELGVVKAYYLLGEAYDPYDSSSFEFKKDVSEAKEWYRKAIKRGNESAKDALEKIEKIERAMKLDVKAKYPNLARIIYSAEKGDAQAQIRLGDLYRSGLEDGKEIVLLRDHDKSMMWYQKAADQGNLDGLYYFAIREHDEDTRLAKLRQIANMGSAKACNTLAYRLHKDHPEEAKKWLIKAAELGFSDAQYELGKAYSGMSPSFKFEETQSEAKEWLNKALQSYFAEAEQGIEDAQSRLSYIYRIEKDFPENAKEIISSWRKRKPCGSSENAEEEADCWLRKAEKNSNAKRDYLLVRSGEFVQNDEKSQRGEKLIIKFAGTAFVLFLVVLFFCYEKPMKGASRLKGV